MKSKFYPFLLINNLAFIAGIFLSYKLWVTNRNFPVTPIIEQLPQLPHSLDQLPILALIGILLMQVIFQKRSLFIVSLLILSYLLCQDLMRWQPWVYLHGLFLFPFCLSSKKGEHLFNYYRIILIGIYFWSGFYKFNNDFAELVFVDSIRQVFNINLTKYSYLAYSIPITEIFIAVALIFQKTRKLASILAILIHLGILLWLSPLGGNSNSVIIPWNLMMIAFIYLCFIRRDDQSFVSLTQIRSFPSLIALSAVFLPILYSFGYWPYYFSFNLYSGQGKSFYISLNDEDFLNEDESFRNSCYSSEYINNRNTINLSSWSYRSLNVPTPNDEKVYIKVAEEICKKATTAEFYISDRIKFTQNSEILTCDNR